MLFKRIMQAALTVTLFGLAVLVPQAPAQAAGSVYGPYYLMSNNTVLGTQQCIADPGASTGDRVQQILWNCGSGGQQFSNETAVTTSDYWTFNSQNGKCLRPVSSSSGAAIVQTSCTTGTIGRWKYISVGGGVSVCGQFGARRICTSQEFKIQNLSTGMCISTNNGAIVRGTGLVQLNCNNVAANKWWQFQI